MKRWVPIILTLGISLILLPLPLGNHTKASDSDFEISNGVLKAYNGDAAEVIIPNTVTEIGHGAFKYNLKIIKVTIPDTVTSIAYDAFFSCDNLENIEIPETVTFIGAYAFEGTVWLTKECNQNPMVVVNGILINGKNCTGDIKIPDTVTEIGDAAFYYNKNILSVSIPKTVTKIGDEAFISCYNLKKVYMTDSVTALGFATFMKCEELAYIRLSNALTEISGATFEGCKSLKKITIPSSVKSIGEGTFIRCTKLSHVSVPDTLKEIDYQAFKGCSSKLTFYGVKNSYVSSYAKTNNFSYKKIALTKTKAALSVGDTLQLKLNSLGRCAWKSSNSAIAAVSTTGKVTAKSKGKATITATLYGQTYKCSITVK